MCGKGPRVGNLVSKAKNRVKRWIYPNVHTMRFTVANTASGEVVRAKVCTKCVKAKKVTKVL